MLFGLGFIILLASTCVECESVLVPTVIAVIGIGLMMLGKEKDNGQDAEL